MEYSDKEIIHSIKKGEDEKALTSLYKRLLPKVKNFICSNNGDEDEAFDIFQDSILIFYKHVKAGKYNEEKEIAGFIYYVSRNLWINRVKRKNRSTSITSDFSSADEDSNILDDLITKEREAYVMKMLENLGERCKELLLYSVFYKLSMKEICEKMGFSTENGVKTRKYKCKQKLVELVKDNMSVKDLLK